jgi:hypothetical protein
MHFGRLVERFSESEESEDEDEDEDEDVPPVVRARMGMTKAVASDEDEDEDVNTSVDEIEQQQQQAGPSKDVQTNEAAWQCWSSSHRAIYSPFVYAPDLIKPAHPFGVYAPGTVPEQGHPAPASSYHVTYQDVHDEEEEEDLMPSETDEEALDVELKAEERLDAADARAAATYEAGVWRELRSASAGAHTHNPGASLLQRSRKRRHSGDGEVDGGVVSPTDLRLRTRKRRKNLRAGASGGYEEELEGADLEMLNKSPANDVEVSAAVIEDSDC